jgi:hypothetical protein
MISHFVTWHIGNDRREILVAFGAASGEAILNIGKLLRVMANTKMIRNVYCILCLHKVILGSKIRG